MMLTHLLYCYLLSCHCQGDIALEFTWVDASGTVQISGRDSAEGKALAGGVGLIGIITEVKLQLTPPSNIRAVSKNLLQDDNIGQDVQGYLKVREGCISESGFRMLMWLPGPQVGYWVGCLGLFVSLHTHCRTATLGTLDPWSGHGDGVLVSMCPADDPPCRAHVAARPAQVQCIPDVQD